MNTKLSKVANSDDFKRMGFVEEYKSIDNPLRPDWNMRTKHFHVIIDAWFDVEMGRLDLNSDYIASDYIPLQVDDLSELQSVVDWIADED